LHEFVILREMLEQHSTKCKITSKCPAGPAGHRRHGELARQPAHSAEWFR
jgi:hypothetical protein